MASSYDITAPFSPYTRVRVTFSHSFDRLPHPNPDVEHSIEKTWQARLSENPSLFNASKFRCEAVTLSDNTCTFSLGLTDYKTYLGTHVENAMVKLTPRHMAMPLGNVVVPLSSDGYTFAIVRSSISAEGVGACVFPGGHPEPSRVSLLGDCVDERVCHELWHGAREELIEELFLKHSNVEDINEMKFLGVVSRACDGKPSMVFSARLHVDAESVLETYRKQNDRLESVRIIKLDRQEVSKMVETGHVGEVKALAEMQGAGELFLQMLRASDGGYGKSS